MSTNEQSDYRIWLRDLQPGDRVALQSRSGWASRQNYEFFEVERVTPSQIVTRRNGAEVRFCRKNGTVKGGNRYGKIQPLTPQVLAVVEECVLRNWLEGLDQRQLAGKLDVQGIRDLKAAVTRISAEVEQRALDNRPKLIGLTEEQAVDMLQNAGHNYRVVNRDGVPRVSTADVKANRANLTIQNGLVTDVSYG
ncbi:hypothetical protein ACODYM_28825 [Burkholderia gladioli]|uniref:hypothetical protein n=1 Tax=Burkholderia gladioli TaxID=28095 RepID=UPI003B51382E